MNSKQNQKSGDGAVNVQAAGNITIGIDYDAAKDIALSVFKENSLTLKAEAAELVFERLEDFIKKLFNKIAESKDETLINKFKDPDIQYVLYAAQVAYARDGDTDNADLLLNLLIDRMKENDRSLRLIVLNESIETIPKLTKSQISALSLAFLVNHMVMNNINNLSQLIDIFNKFYIPLISDLESKQSHYQHLVSTGCANIGQIAFGTIYGRLLKNYSGLFSKGFTLQKFTELYPNNALIKGYLMQCLNNPTLVQFKILNEDGLKVISAKLALENTILESILSLHNSTLMNENEIQQLLESQSPKMIELFSIWVNTPLSSMTLSTVGIAIAHANIQRYSHEKFDLSIWI